jgi:hypothetical protein
MVIDFWPAFFGTLAAIALWRSAPIIFKILVLAGVTTHIHWDKVKTAWNIFTGIIGVLAVIGIIIKASE